MSKIEKVYGISASKFDPEAYPFKIIKAADCKPGEEPIEKKELVVLTRPQCENDKNYRHFATYAIIQDSEGKVLAYPRSTGSTEQRLAGKWSIGVGGHVTVGSNDIFNCLHTILALTSTREIHEELFDNGGMQTCTIEEALDIFCPHQATDTLTYLLDNTNDVGRRHIAAIFRYSLPDELKAKIISTEEIQKFIWIDPTDPETFKDYDFESWSKIILDNFMSLPGNRNPVHSLYGEKPFA